MSPFRVPLAREQLRQRLVSNAGVDPHTGFWLNDNSADYADETEEERANRIEYFNRLDQAVSHIAGLIEGCHIRVWRDRHGAFELAPPVSTAQAFYAFEGHVDDLYFDRSEWQSLFETRYPRTELALRLDNERDSATIPLSSQVHTKLGDDFASIGIGRPRGSGSLSEKDKQLYSEVDRLLASGEFTSPTSAAWSLIDRIAGSGAPESLVKRFIRRYKRDRKGS